jgi:hypothetical protein
VSGPKSGDYYVVSEAELRRRRIAAARDRYSRVLATVQTFQGDLSAAHATYGSLAISVPQVTVSDARKAEDWDRASDTLTSGLADAQRQLEDAVRAARLRKLSAEGSRVSAVFSEEPRARRSAPSASTESAESAVDDRKLADILGRLPTTAPADVVSRCERLARGCREAAGRAEKARVLDGIRHLVQAERDRQAHMSRNSAVIEELYRELDGLSDDAVDTLRGVLKGLDRSATLPDGLRDQVATAKAAAEAQRDREFVLATAARALADLGYAVGEDFRTAVPSSGTLLELPHSRRHGLQIRERNHQLMLNVVRFDQDGQRDPRADKNAEESFCRDFAKLKNRMHEEGVDLAMLRADAPGQTPVQVVRDTSRVRRSATRATALRERQRSS